MKAAKHKRKGMESSGGHGHGKKLSTRQNRKGLTLERPHLTVKTDKAAKEFRSAKQGSSKRAIGGKETWEKSGQDGAKD